MTEQIKEGFEGNNGDTDRSAAAQAIRLSRKLERGGREEYGRENNRDVRFYQVALAGLDTFLAHVRNLPKARVLDVGAGTTRGTSQLASSEMGKGLEFEATVLVDHPDIEKNLGKDKTHITSVENLSGIEDSSFGGVLGVWSVTYSAAPELAVRQIDRVLCPGGVFKGNFSGTEQRDGKTGLVTRPAKPFKNIFKEMGYDTAILRIRDPQTRRINSILIARKQTGDPWPQPTAEELLKWDELEAKKILKWYKGQVWAGNS